MKKILFLTLMIVFLSGCDVKQVDSMSLDQIIETVTTQNQTLYNRVGVGYKYYLPMGVLVESSDDYNEVLYTDQDIYYLYVDVVSFYNHQNLTVEKIENAYFYKEFEQHDVKGSLQILENESQYYIKAIYNYSKIETMIEKDRLKATLYRVINILSSIDYNESVIKSTIEKQKQLDSKEITIKDFTPKKNTTTFLEYIEKYDDYDKSDKMDQFDIDQIIPNYTD